MNKHIKTGTIMAKHNKKRNVGLIHEQLVRFASEKIVEKKNDKAVVAISILDKHFNEGSELYREFRLFNALVHTKVNDRGVAKRIIQESKAACKNYDANKLRSEKSLLIKVINYDLDDKNFFNKKLPEYKVFATVQALLNEWRGADKLAPNEIIKYETVLEEWLVRSGVDNNKLQKNNVADPLALKIMIEKFNLKYSSKLNSNQSKLLEYKLMNDNENALKQVAKIKRQANVMLCDFYKICDNKVLNEKKILIENKINALEPNIDDETIAKALMLAKLIETIGE